MSSHRFFCRSIVSGTYCDRRWSQALSFGLFAACLWSTALSEKKLRFITVYLFIGWYLGFLSFGLQCLILHCQKFKTWTCENPRWKSPGPGFGCWSCFCCWFPKCCASIAPSFCRRCVPRWSPWFPSCRSRRCPQIEGSCCCFGFVQTLILCFTLTFCPTVSGAAAKLVRSSSCYFESTCTIFWFYSMRFQLASFTPGSSAFTGFA